MKLNIAYSCDEMYIAHTGISILSLLENNKDFEAITIYFIEKDVTPESLELLRKMIEGYNRKLEVISFYDLCSGLKINTLGRHIETVYVKLFFSRIPDIDKIFYIDSDTIINGSLKSLWDIDMSNYLIGGVETPTVGAKKELELVRSDKFINDGVALVNLKEFREQKIEQKFIDCIASYDGDPPVLSEGVINKVCKGKIKVLHPKYNLMSGLINFKMNKHLDIKSFYSEKTLKEAYQDPIVIHYLAAFYNRPWDINCTHPLKDKYLYYKSISIWKDLPLQNKKLDLRLRVIGFLYRYLPNSILDYIRISKNKKA